MRFVDVSKIDYNHLEQYKYYELEHTDEIVVAGKNAVKVYKGDEKDFRHNGITTLTNLTSCYVTEELNGGYFIELECIKDKTNKYLALQPLNIIKADGQLFRIPFKESIQDNDFRIKINANHIFYDLDYGYLPDITLKNTSIIDALDYILTGNDNFNLVECDIEGNHQCTFENVSPVQAIYKKVLSLWGGELYRDNYTVSVKQIIGDNTDIVISYGKNILGFSEIVDSSAIITRAYPVGKDGLTIETVNKGIKFIDSPRITNYPVVFERRIDFSEVDDPNVLLDKTKGLWGEVDIPKTTYKVKIADLAKTKEYELIKDFITLKLGDVVTIRHKIFDVELRAKVIKIKKNILLGTIEEIELGQFLPTLFNKISSMTSSIGKTEQAVKESTAAVDNMSSNLGAVTAGLLDRPTFEQAQVLIDKAIKSIDLSSKVDNTVFSKSINNLQEEINTVNDSIERKLKRIKVGVV